MIELLKLQRAIYQNKVDRNFNVEVLTGILATSLLPQSCIASIFSVTFSSITRRLL